MKRAQLFFLLNFYAIHLFAQDPDFVWAKSIGGSSGSNGFSITTDGSGNVYTTGYFTGTVDFDPGTGITNLTAGGYTVDMFIEKLDSGGNLVWVKSAGGDNDVIARSITTDASDNVYATGYFYGTADFDPGFGITNLTSIGFGDIFILKLDVAGNFVWAKSMGGVGEDVGYSITIDGNGNVYTTGSFNWTVDFDPGNNETELTATGTDPNPDIFIQKLDASGNFVWAESVGGISGDGGLSIATDADGNVYTTGFAHGIVDFDPGPSVTNLDCGGMFIQKLDDGGNFFWANSISGTFSSADAASIVTDAGGNVYTTGHFFGTIDFDPGPAVTNLTPVGDYDIFIQKLDASGNFAWAKSMGGANEDDGYSITTDADGNLYTTGVFKGVADFDQGPDIANLTSVGDYDIFIQKSDAAGNFVWAKSMGGTGDDHGFDITTHDDGSVYTTGYFRGTVDFDPGAGVANLTAVDYDIFIQKLSEGPTGIPENNLACLVAYPNPTNGHLTLTLGQQFEGVTVSVKNILDQNVYTQDFDSRQKLEITLGKSAGVYVLNIHSRETLLATLKVIKQ